MHNVLALEFHSVDVPWWADMVTGINNPIFENGFIKVPEKPGIGFDELNEEVIKEHINPQILCSPPRKRDRNGQLPAAPRSL